jgi:hypothetical protein
MTRDVVAILEAALRLNPEDRAELANELLASLIDEDTVTEMRPPPMAVSARSS